MSSHRVSVSGDRQYSITAGGGQYTSAQMSGKQGDQASISLGAFAEILFAVSPGQLIIERYHSSRLDGEIVLVKVRAPNGDSEYVSPISLSMECRSTLDDAVDKPSTYPHTNIDVRKDPGGERVTMNHLGDLTLIESIDLAKTTPEE